MGGDSTQGSFSHKGERKQALFGGTRGFSTQGTGCTRGNGCPSPKRNTYCQAKKVKEDRTNEEAEQQNFDCPNSPQIFLAIKTVSAS